MSSNASAFSSSDKEALDRDIEHGETRVTLEAIWNDTHSKVCTGWIRQNGFKRICLQFPDDYLPHSNKISDSLTEVFNLSDTKVFILADTTYGSCCVDEIAAAHVDADSIIHFGKACRSKISRLPVLYMFPQLPIDVELLLDKLITIKDICIDRKLYIYLDVGYHHLLETSADHLISGHELDIDKIEQLLTTKELHVETFPASDEANNINCEIDDQTVCVFVGADNSNFFNLSVCTKAVQWYIYDVATNTINKKNPLTTNYIRRRYYYIEKCKDAQTLGLIVATLTAQGYLEVIARLQEMAKSHGIKTQIISVGRINPAKLANFLEIDCFVLIGCPFNNMYTSKEYYKPIVSVFEAEMALNPTWYMKYPETYVTDFKQLLPDGRNFLRFNAAEIAQHDVSLVSGRMRKNNTDDTVEASDTTALSEQQQNLGIQNKMEIMTTNIGLTFEDRTWKGLEPALGQTEPAKIQKGLSGVPIEYKD